jgi:iron complex outermembrane receptor protein
MIYKNKIMKKYFFVSIFLLLTSLIFSQNKTIKGVVIDEKTKEPIANAVVKIKGTNTYTVTNLDGKFELKAAITGKLEISILGYESTIENVCNCNMNVCNCSKICMKQSKISLDEIIVKANPLQDISHSVTVVDDIKKGSQPRNVTDLFKDIPGFSIQKRSATATEPSLRSFKYEQMNIKYDGGMKMVNACPNRMDPITAHVIPEEVRKIEVVKGPYTVRFGQSFGGIVNMITKAPTPDNYGFSGSVQSGYETNGGNFVARAELMYAKEKFDFTIDGERRDFGNYTDGNSVETSSGFETTSYSLKAGYNPSNNQRLQIDWRQKFGKDIMHVGLPMDSPKDDSYMVGLDYKISSMSDKIKSISVKGYYSFVDHLMSNGYDNDTYTRPNYPAMDARTPVTSNTLGGKFEIGITPSDKLLIYTGLDADIIMRDGDKTVVMNINPATGLPFTTPIVKNLKVWQDATISDYGIFAEVNYKLTNKITTTAGLRTDFVNAGIDDVDAGFEALYGGEIKDQFDVVIGGNISAKYRNNGLQMQLAYGRGTRTPSMVERYIYRFVINSDSRDYIGNPYLKPEINNQFEFSVNKKTNKINVGASVFYSIMEDYITAYINSAFTASTAGCGGGPILAPKQFINVSANQYGFDAFFNYKFTDELIFKSDIALTKAYNETFDEPLAQIAPMSAHLGLKYEKEKYWIDLRSEIVAKQADFSPSFNETESPGYNTFDLRLGYKPTTKFSLGASILNIFDTAYYNHLNFAFKNADENNGMRIYEVGRNFSIYAKYNF